MKPIFVIGNSRSGTTLLGRILGKHSKVYTLPHEIHIFDDIFEGQVQGKSFSFEEASNILAKIIKRNSEGYFSSLDNIDFKYIKEAKEQLAKRNRDIYSTSDIVSVFFNYIKPNLKEYVCEQTPRNIFYVKEILSIYPNAKFINLVRDPRGVLLSQKNKWRACFKIGQPILETMRAFFNYHPFNILFLWRKCVTTGQKLALEYPQNVLTVNFDQLSVQSEFQLKKICDFIGLRYVDTMLDINVEMSSNAEREGQKGIDLKVSNAWVSNLSPTEIFFAEKMMRREIESFNYPVTNKKFFLPHLLFWALYWPMTTFLALLFNPNIFKKVKMSLK